MQLTLHPHAATPPADPPFRVWASAELAASFGAMATLNLWFSVGAPADRFVLPASDATDRRDELWKTTCFEAFLKADGEEGYREWNFAPSGDWAAYDFTGRREGMTEADVGAAPYIRVEDNLTWWTLGATIAVEAGQVWGLGLTAVLDEKGGAKSYWALKHGADAPDFHHPDCFAARLA